MERIKVRLNIDLTKYHPKLVSGVEGATVGRFGLWSRGSDRFVGVHFPGIGTFDILWNSLEIIDGKFLTKAAHREQKRWQSLKTARNVARVLGPRGGFRHLSYEYDDENGVRNHVSNHDRQEADLLIHFFRKHGITVSERVIR